MAVTDKVLDEVAKIIEQQGADETGVRALREIFSDLHFTACMDDDVCEVSPVRELKTCNLYLADSRDHCIRFTTDLANATGIVVAELDDEA